MGGFEIRDSQTLNVISIHKNSKITIDSNHREKDNLWSSSFTFTSNSKALFVGCNNSAIYVWDFTKRKETEVLTKHTNCIASIAISQDNRFLASSSYNELIVWDVLTLNLLAERIWSKTNLGNILFHPNGTLLAIEPEGKEILNLNSADLEIIDRQPVQGAKRMCLSNDGSKICVGGWGWLKIIDFSTKECLFDSQLESQNFEEFNSPEDICFDEYRQLFIITFMNGKVMLFDISSGMISSVISHLPEVLGTDFRNATGISQDLAEQLKNHGAIMDD